MTKRKKSARLPRPEDARQQPAASGAIVPGGVAVAEPKVGELEPSERGVSIWAIAWRQFKRDRVALFSLVGLVVLALAALLSPLLANDKPLVCSYKGGLYFPAFKDYLDPNIPIPFGIPDRLRRTFPSISPTYKGTPLPRDAGASTPNWKRLRAMLDVDGRDGWYLRAPVPYYYKETSSATKVRPFGAVADLTVQDGPSEGEVVEIIPRHEWDEVKDRLRWRDPSFALERIEVDWSGETERWAAHAVPPAEGAPDVPVLLGGEPLGAAPQPLTPGDVLSIGGRGLRFTIPPAHPLGTDADGRDVLSRLIHGCVIAGSVGFISVGIYVVIGVILGAIAGYFRGWVDIVISRVIEVVICFPTFFLIITIVAVMEASIYNVMIALGLTGWTGVARLVRGEFLKCMAEDYVQAARALGLSDLRIIFRHVLPNAMAPVFVSASFGVAGAILVESSLSFLGFGVSPPTASWGEILQQGRDHINENCYHLVWFPGLAIFVTVTLFNLVGEGLRDALDPKLRQ